MHGAFGHSHSRASLLTVVWFARVAVTDTADLTMTVDLPGCQYPSADEHDFERTCCLPVHSLQPHAHSVYWTIEKHMMDYVGRK